MRLLYDHQIFAIQRFGGISRLFVELIGGLAPRTECSVHWYRGLHAGGYDVRDFRQQLGGYWSLCPPRGLSRFVSQDRLNQRALGWFARRHGRRFDIYHPTYWDASLPERVGAGKLVLTVCDLIPEIYFRDLPRFAPLLENRRRLIGMADHLLVISDHTRDDLMAHYRVPSEKITRTYLAADMDALQPAKLPESARNRPYFLYVGTRSKYKNFELLARAFAECRSLRDRFDVICFGGSGDFTPAEQELFDRHGLRSNFSWLRGDDRLLKALYCGAESLVYTSRYEGFGLPPLEAMQCGCPVVCVPTSSLPEVVGDAALHTDADAPDELAAQLLQLVDAPALRRTLVEAGKRQAAKFSWRRTVEETHDCYQRLLRTQSSSRVA